jgi:hypothetical protein
MAQTTKNYGHEIMPQVNFKYPMKGLNQNYAASTQPSFTTAFLNNVRPYDVLENRARGGQRPGQLPMFQQILGYNYQDPTDCVALWHMDQNSVASGGTVIGQIGSLDLTEGAGEAMLCENSPFGGAIIFDGDSEFLESAAADGTTLDIVADLTIVAWIKPADITGTKRIVSLYDDSVSNIAQYELWLDGSTLKGSVGTDTPATYTATKTGVVASQWQKVVMTVSGTTVQVYLNAVAGTPDTTAGTRIGVPAGDKVTVGARWDTAAEGFFAGSICNVMIYNEALNAAGVTALLSGVGQSVVDIKQVEFIEV